MTTFLYLSDTFKGYLIALLIISMIILLIALIIYLLEKKKSFHTILLFFLLIIIILDLSALSELNKCYRDIFDFSMHPISITVNQIPYFLQIIFGSCNIIFALYSIFTLYINNKNKISAFSVKEALENLPTGIAFMSSSSELLLSNHIIHALCKELTGKTLQSCVTFWSDLLNLQSESNCVISGKAPAFALANGEVWHFSKILCNYNNDDYYQIKATNITEFYNLSENTKSVNEKLLQQQQTLKKLSNIVNENAKEQVAVNMKINFHDNFGNLLTLTKKALREKENIDDAKTLINYWENLNNVITELSNGEKQSLTLEQIMLFSHKLGCNIIITGDMPTEHNNSTTILLCINEMLKNAYIHAGANKITVNIIQTDSEINFTIHNETKNKIEKIVEGGGLTGLRQRIEHLGGKMKIDSYNGVTMFVTLYKHC